MHVPPRRLATMHWLFLAVLAPAAPAAADYLAASLGPNFYDSSVLRYNADGSPAAAGSIPSFTAGLGFSQGVTVGPGGNIYVSSNNLATGAGEILFFDPTGAPLAHAGGQSGLFATLPFNPPAEEGGNPTPPSPAGLRFSPDGTKLYVADREGTTVRVFDAATGAQLADAATGLQAPTGLAFGPDGALYVSNFNSGVVTRVAGGVQTDFITPTQAGPYTPSSLLWLPSGNLLAVDVIGNQVLEFSGSGSFVRQFAVPPPAIPDPLPDGVNFPTNSPADIIFDEDGNLVLGILGLTYPPDNRGALLRYDLDGTLLETITDGVPGVGALAFIKPAGAIAGDYNGDGQVGTADYDKWSADFGKWVARGGGADGDGNGIVDAADYTIWRDALPGVLDGAGAAAAVPEPSMIMFAVFGAFIAAGGRARSRNRR